jgi:hypothetical protein
MPFQTPSNYVSQQNQTVAGQLVSSLVSSGQSTVNFLANELTAAGHAVASVGNFVSSSLDNLLTGSEVASFFGSGSAQRVTQNALDNRFSLSDNVNPWDKIYASQHKTNGKTNLSYPLDQAPYYMKLTFFEYSRANPLAQSKEEPIGTISLPLPDASGFVDSTVADWAQSKGNLTGNVLDQLKKMDDLLKNPKGIVGDALYNAAQSFVTSMSPEAGGALSSVTGLAPNPSLAMLFNGVNFRNFNLNWTFVPQNVTESATIKEIIKYIKRNHLPTFAAGGTSYNFNYPSIVQPKFVGMIDEDYLTKFKKCVIKSVNVNYAPQNHASFYKETHAPAAIQLTIGLEEMEYVLAYDYGKLEDGRGVINAASRGVYNLFPQNPQR